MSAAPWEQTGLRALSLVRGLVTASLDARENDLDGLSDDQRMLLDEAQTDSLLTELCFQTLLLIVVNAVYVHAAAARRDPRELWQEIAAGLAARERDTEDRS